MNKRLVILLIIIPGIIALYEFIKLWILDPEKYMREIEMTVACLVTAVLVAIYFYQRNQVQQLRTENYHLEEQKEKAEYELDKHLHPERYKDYEQEESEES